MERLARFEAEHDDEYRAFCKATGNYHHERAEARLARALLRLLPVVRAALEYHRVRTGQRTNGSQQTLIERGTRHTLMHAVDELRRGLEDSNGQP
jgi:hypothetical protein